ncbi:MAG: glycosyltransferase [Schaedlerella sp.]|nr:glycosyltransferase [Schaedlerella sp.]
MKNKKRIFIMSHAMELGGAERSLLGLLDAIDTNIYEVDLFLMRHEGELLQHIPTKINLLPEIPSYTVLARPMKDTLLEGHVILTFARLCGKICAIKYDRDHDYTDSGVALEYSHKYTVSLLPKIQPNCEYDLAISFLTPHYYVAQKVRAKQKIAWIHTDYNKVQIDKESEYNMWSEYDKIISISDAVTNAFIDIFPALSEKIVLVENILPQSLVQSQKAAFSVEKEMPDKGIKLLSIGRYCTAKNFDNVPEICKKLIEAGNDVYWYIIGFGPDEALIRSKIEQYHMEERVILLGKKDNPYPYINSCDWYVQPSRYEGKSVTVREAQMLGKPVIITNYATSHSQLDDGVDGIIVPLGNKACADEIGRIILNIQLRDQLSVNCSTRDYSNSAEINCLYELLD